MTVAIIWCYNRTTMKKDKLQDRKLYRVAYFYAENQCEIITIGADSSHMFAYHIVAKQAREIFEKKYANYQNRFLKVL